jgi:hypothetical protein
MNKTTYEQFEIVELPDNTSELQMADIAIEKQKKRFKIIKLQRKINNIIHEEIYEETVRILDFLGKLTKPLFELNDSLEYDYIKKYPTSPQLAKKLWLCHCENIHYPYDLLKNRCFKLLEDVDEEFIKRNKTYPANYNI